MPVAGLEPARITPHDFESCASANSATPATQYRKLSYHNYSSYASKNCEMHLSFRSFIVRPAGARSNG